MSFHVSNIASDPVGFARAWRWLPRGFLFLITGKQAANFPGAAFCTPCLNNCCNYIFIYSIVYVQHITYGALHFLTEILEMR